jgi:hypothetical protein
VVCVVAIALLGLLSGDRESSRHSAHPTAAATKARGTATREYWQQLVSILGSLNQGLAESATGSSVAQIQQKRQLLATASAQVSRLPVLDVDPEAVEIGSRLVQQFGDQEAVFSACERLVTDVGAVNERAKSPDFLLESFLRGFAGDPLGAQNDLRAEQGKLSARHERLMDQAETCQRNAAELRAAQGRTRAALSARYGTEFGPLE